MFIFVHRVGGSQNWSFFVDIINVWTLNNCINQTQRCNQNSVKHRAFCKNSCWLSAINYFHSYFHIVSWDYINCNRLFRLITDKRKCYFFTRKKSLLPMCSNFLWTKTKEKFPREVILFYWKKLKWNGRGRQWKLVKQNQQSGIQHY